MKKFWNLMLAALVIIGAAACTENNENVENAQEAAFSFYAEIVNDTRATIADEDGDKTWETKWELGDKLYVNDTYEFVCTDVEKGRFTCYDDAVAELAGTAVTITTDGKHHSLQGANAFYTTATVENFGEGKVELQALTSFFRFTYNGEVKISLSADAFRTEEGVAVNEITVSGNGEQFVAFWPTGEEVALSYAVNGETIRMTTKALAAGMVYNLGTLVASNASEYGVVGSFQGWDVAASATVKMTHVASDWAWVVAENVELYKSDEFKVITGNSWDNPNFGAKDAVLVAEPGKVNTLVQGGQNIKVNTNGKFNLYFNPTSKAFKYDVVEEYTDLVVNITINNKANWSPLYITLKSGNTTIADEATVTNNKYAVSGNYIGETLSYVLSNGSKTMEGNVSITKDGATITLEETVIKLMVQLDTANSKQWWGNTMKIHAWNTGTSFDTSWPGNTMTSEGNYTWSIIVPSDLVGKTIKYLVHNGNGWQSKDSTITIKAEGNTVTGSSIGIN
jgi:hypothetical protein